MNKQLNLLDQLSDPPKAINVASVPQRSPFRYPGGKTWLIPVVRKWLKQNEEEIELLIEPFAGGGIVSLTTAFEDLARKIVMVEIDSEVAAVWEMVINGKGEDFAERIFRFDLTLDNVNKELANPDKKLEDIAFCTILKNRIYHGGIIANGAGMLKKGENGKGISSRWYPKTLRDRIVNIQRVRDKIDFIKGDAFKVITENLEDNKAFFFIDPPYTLAGKRMYSHFDIDHEKLFSLVSRLKGKYIVTYDDTQEIRNLADKYNLLYRTIPMRTTHHKQKNEIIISDNFSWWNSSNI